MSKSKRNNQDWRSQLAQLNQQMKDNMSEEEKKKMRQEEAEKRRRKQEVEKRKHALYEFLSGYKQNSGIFINNFFRNRDYKTYCADKFHIFDFDFHGTIMPNVFDDMAFSLYMVRYLGQLEEAHIAYFPIETGYIKHLINFAEVLELVEPLESDTTFYRGCSTIERNGVSGLVSVTAKLEIAQQFSRGTVLTVHVPKGTPILNLNAIRPKSQRNKDLEQEYLIPPFEYEILSSQEVKKGREPNNHTGRTKLLEIKVKPLDFLEEFLKAMENPPQEYFAILSNQEEAYEEALTLLKNYIRQKASSSSSPKVKSYANQRKDS